ncbi:MAG: 5'/3'-nucleotidase SurE [Thermoleophilia bacterium]|nr:5'/3'-nucleotidase SurE [Thermoleophilia bacterium]
MPSASGGKLHVLLTNDDGFSKEGLQVWRRELIARGLAVSVIAPAENQSGRARAVSCHGSVAMEAIEETSGELVFACSGSPVDCVRVGILGGLLEPVDLVLSGINHGANLGDDITYSGTAGAAFEAALLGARGLAMSQQDDAGDIGLLSDASHSFELAGFAAHLAEIVAAAEMPAGAALNVNLPCRVEDDEVRVVRPGRITYPEVTPIVEAHGDGRYDVWPYARPGAADPAFEFAPDTDYGAIADGAVALTPIARSGGHLPLGEPWLRAIAELASEALRSRESRAASPAS